MRLEVYKVGKGDWIASYVLGDGADHTRHGNSRVDALQHLKKHLEIVKRCFRQGDN